MRTLRLGITAQSQAERSLGPSLANQPSIYAGDSCDASRQPLTLLQRNDTTGLYDVMRTVSEEEYADHQDNRQVIKNQNRQLFASFEENVLGAPLFTTTSTSDRNGHYRHLQGLSVSRIDNDPDAMLLGRACPCSPVEGTYCPVGQYNCRIAFANAYRERVEVTCTAQGQDFFLRYVFPLTIFMFLFFGCLCFCSPKGKYSMGYMKKLVCCWNDERYEQYLNEALDRMAQLQYTRQMRLDRLRAYQASSRRVAMPRERYMLPGSAREASPTDTAGIAVARQSVVVLKTMKYEDVVRRELGKEQEEEMCAICLNVFQEGDRVGNVRCGHVFHVLCLKVSLCYSISTTLDNFGSNASVSVV